MAVVLNCTNLQRRFASPGGAVEVLSGASLELAAGEVVAVLGPSGSGKSTPIHLLGGLDRPDAGQIWWGDFPVHQHAPSELSERRAHYVGLVFQNHYLLSDLSLLENVSLPSRIIGRPDETRARELLTKVGLEHRLHHTPSRVSGGERQRAAVARALALKPALLLADEPTGSLDRQRAADVLDLLLQLSADEGTAVVVVTHDESLVAAAGMQVVRLAEGRLSDKSQLPGPAPHATPA